VTSLRRGVLAKIEPADHRVWTVRLIRDFVERMVAIADPRAGAHDAAAANQIAARIVGLCPRSVLVAPGPHNAALRDAAPAHGLAATEDLGAALALAEALVDAPAPTPAERPEKPTAREPRGPSPVQLLRDAVEAGADVDALVEILAPLRQRFRAFKPIRTAIDTLSPAEADSRVVAVLEALRRTATEDERLPEGVTVAIRMSALAPGGATAEWLAGPGAERFGGPGIDRVTGVAAALEAAGCDTGGLWRVRAKRNEVRGEVWYCQDLTPEGRGIAARLALQEGARAVIAADEDLGAWLATLPGVEPIAWSEDAPAAAVGGLPDAPAEG
jgi:hypothetical protein